MSTPESTPQTAGGGAADTEALRQEAVRLGPWAIDVEITPELSTGVAHAESSGDQSPELGRVGFYSPHDHFVELLRRIYPGGLEGRSVLDCACNCGAFSFFAKEAGAGACFGFDVRRHWIDQARFLARNRTAPTDGMRFDVCDLYDLPKLGLGPWDITTFNGIFYHLPDPVSGLKVAADLTGELLIVNTASRSGVPDGALVVAKESPTQLMSGVYGLNWFPSGPAVLERILSWMGFPETRCVRWRDTPGQGPGLGRIEVVAAREQGFFEAYDSAPRSSRARLEEAVNTRVPPNSTVLTTSGGDDSPLALRGRQGVHFPANDEGAYAPAVLADEAALVAQLERRAADAAFIAVDEDVLSLTERRVLSAVLGGFPVIVEGVGFRVHQLRGG